jgi:preprotein translocase subunit SecF
LNIVGKRYWFFALSTIVIIPGIIAIIFWGLPLAIDFTGGSILEVRFDSGAPPAPAEVVELYDDLGVLDPIAQSAGTTDIVVRSKLIDETTKALILDEMETRFEGPLTLLRFDSVGPSIGIEVAQQAAGAIGFAALFILLYITYAFRGVPNARRFGIAAIIAMLHDVAVVIGVEAILGHYLGWEVDALFLTALLTVIGFSVHDSIVVFDRIRENQRRHRLLKFEQLVNHSIVQTLDRSINTQLTVMLTLLALLLFGGVTTRHFVTILLIGVFSGTYSSIFNAAPILVVWENHEWRSWFRRKERAVA